MTETVVLLSAMNRQNQKYQIDKLQCITKEFILSDFLLELLRNSKRTYSINIFTNE